MPAPGERVPSTRTPADRAHRSVWICRALLVLVLAYGAFLRLDGLFIRYGPLTEPRWATTLARYVGAARDPLVPAEWHFEKIERPYVGGDPINYLRFAREMRHFYQPHVREPVFLAGTRFWLWVLGDQDVGISFASVAFSLLAVLATYHLGAALGGMWVGLAAAAPLAVDWDMVAWSSEGWRDDAFTAVVAAIAWATMRYWRRRTWMAAGVLGLLAGIGCLTRITALSFVLPALAVLALARGSHRRADAARMALAAAVTTAIVAPYLINCYREFGDPFVSINAHTAFYRASAGQAPEPAQGALAYAAERFTTRPITAVDTAFQGLFVFPFENKWGGLRWVPYVSGALRALALAGLFAWLWIPAGRIAILLLLTSLTPYMLTWSLPGGDHWRFTMHAYPFYLVAAAFAAAVLVRHGKGLAATRLRAISAASVSWRRITVHAVVALGLAATLFLERYWAPMLMARETLAAGDAVTIQAGENDEAFFAEGWSDLVATGAVTARFAVSTEATVLVPLPEKRPYVLALRLDPLPDRLDQRVRVFIDGTLAATHPLTWSADRVGSYEVAVAPDLAGKIVRLTVVADTIAPAGAAASRYPGISETQPVAFRMWYVRVRPS